jgi:hypothetical protein
MPTNVWLITIDLKDTWNSFQDVGLEASLEQIVTRIKGSGWRELTPYPDTFDDLISDLEASTTLGEFNAWWAEVYDLADSDRVWIETF